MTAPSWRGDPTLIVYAVRYALGRTSHAPEMVRQAIAANAEELPGNARNAIATAITEWLDGPGADAPRVVREPWVMALAALGQRTKARPARARTGAR